MGKGFYNTFLAAVMAVLLLLCAVPVTADTSPASAHAPVVDSGVPGDAPEEIITAWDEVGSFAELTDWLKSHQKIGGGVRLTNDIELPAGERYNYDGVQAYDPMLYIDVGEHSIYVGGHLQLAPYLDFFGKGGEDGIFHVKQGGYLSLVSDYDYTILSVRAEEGYAIYQEDGAFLGCYTDDIIGGIRYPELAVAWPFSDVSEFYGHIEYFPVTVQPLEGEISEAYFPQTIRSYLCDNGESGYDTYDLPVSWNFAEFEEQLAARERFVLTGEYTGAVTALVQPACLVTFLREDAAVFLQCAAYKKGEDKLIFDMRIKLDDPSRDHRLEWSIDGENWKRANAEDIDEDNDLAVTDEYLFWWIEEEDGIVKYEGSFNMAELPRYFSVATTDAEGRITYSDTIYLDGNDKVAGYDDGGNRGGGTGIGPPQLPLIDGGEDTAPAPPDVSGKPEGPETSEPEEPEGPQASEPEKPVVPAVPGRPLPPTGGNLSDSPAETPSQAPLPIEGSSTAPSKPAPYRPVFPQTDKQPPHAAAIEPAPDDEAQATYNQQDPTPNEIEAQAAGEEPTETSASAKAVAQAAAGAIATGGIIVLSMTWSGWGKRLLDLFRGLIKR